MVNIIISTDPRYKINREAIRLAILEVIEGHKVSGRVELGVSVVGDRKMHELNRKYRGIDAPTDILSFALEELASSNLRYIASQRGFVAAPDKTLRLGDIIISHPQAVEDAAADSISVDEEMMDLVRHGTVHLLGIHHDEGS